MRIPKSWVPVLAREIVADLLRKEAVELTVSRDQAIAVLEELIMEELSIEDRLNAEIHEMLKKYDSEIEKGRLDYRRLFDMTKQKLVRERNIIL
jgi:hypothetical protein